MRIGQKFNKLTLKDYFFYIDHYKKYTDFNTLGLYRSIMENEKLGIEDKIAVREYANTVFKKSFDFLQLKDPKTYFDLITLGKELTKADEAQIWKDIISNQQKILSDKKIKHRNFGNYSKHNCGYEDCNLNGLMIRQGSSFSEDHMYFNSDKNKYIAKEKSKSVKSDRKKEKKIIEARFESE